jgi:hypothetical protein
LRRFTLAAVEGGEQRTHEDGADHGEGQLRGGDVLLDLALVTGAMP